MAQLRGHDALSALHNRQVKPPETKSSRYKPVILNMTPDDYQCFEKFAEKLKKRGLISTTKNSRGLILRRALKIYQDHIADISDLALALQHEHTALAALRVRRKSKG